MNSTVKTVLFWLMILVAAGLLWKVVQMSTGGPKEADASFSEFSAKVDQGLVKEVTVNGRKSAASTQTEAHSIL